MKAKTFFKNSNFLFVQAEIKQQNCRRTADEGLDSV